MESMQRHPPREMKHLFTRKNMFTRTQKTVPGRAPSTRLLLLAALSLLWVSCGDLTDYDAERVESALNDSLLSTTETWDVNMTLLEKGYRRITLEGSYAITYQEPERNETQIDGPVYIQIFDSTGTLESEAWSKSAIYHTDDREFELMDSVRVETVTDRRLYSDYLKWQERTDRITSDNYVTIITPRDSISGSGFTGKTDLSNYTIANPRGRLTID